MAHPNPMEIVDAIATIIESGEHAGVVVRDPLYSENPRDQAELLRNEAGEVDGWLVFAGEEEPPVIVGKDADAQTATFYAEALTQVNPNRAGGGSLAYHGAKVEEAKGLFRLNANRDLGLSSAGPPAVTVRHEGLYAADGHARIALDLLVVHDSLMTLRVFVKEC